MLVETICFKKLQTDDEPVSQPAFTVLTQYDYFLMPAVSCLMCVCARERDEEGEKKSLSGGKCCGSGRRRCRVADTSATDTLTPQALDLLFFTTKSSSRKGGCAGMQQKESPSDAQVLSRRGRQTHFSPMCRCATHFYFRCMDLIIT